MSDTRKQRACTVCGGGEVRPLLRIDKSPVFVNQLCRTKQQALASPVAPIVLGYCTACSHVFNTVFDAALLQYNPEYDNSLHFSPRFQAYADDLAAELTVRYALRGKTVVEVGCGRGDFLAALCRIGSCRGYGFDPSAPTTTDSRHEGLHSVSTHPYDKAQAHIAADLLTCRHCLEHIAAPTRFLSELGATLAEASTGRVFFEVPNALYTLRDGGIWDIIYEHCSYFTPMSLHRAFTLAGYGVETVSTAFGEQFLTLHATRGAPCAVGEQHDGADTHAASFAATYASKIAHWRDMLRSISKSGQRVVVWGAGSKGNNFLNTLGNESSVEFVVDINPRKHGKYVVGTAQRIVDPAFLLDYDPHVVIVMNAIYRDEIGKSLLQMGLKPEIMCA